MKQLPRILIMGRPNVGKSTFVNRLIGKHKAITLDVPGVTRDLSEFPMDWNGKNFLVVDSGGVLFDTGVQENIQQKIEALVVSELERADKIVFLADFKAGVHPLDFEVSKILRPYKEKVTLCINKVDDFSRVSQIGEFYKIGLGDPFPISSFHGTGIGDLLDHLTKDFSTGAELENPTYKVAIVGRPNVGKSSLLNAILNEDRVMVDDAAGTTRDSIEAYYISHGQRYVFIDTAGIRRKTKVEDGIEYYSVIRSTRAIEGSDVVVMVLNPELLLCDQDKKIISTIMEAKRAMVIFINKWDTTDRTAEAQAELQEKAINQLPFLRNYPFVFGSATEKIHLARILDWIPKVAENAQHRISTPQLNNFVDNIIKRNPPPAKFGERVRMYYATQVSVDPPTFVCFVNKPKVIEKDYQRFLENRLREAFPHFIGVPIQLYFKARRKVELGERPAKNPHKE